MTVRERTEQREEQFLSKFASFAAGTKGRERSEPECGIRTCYQRDVDRITHSKAFRRLVHKTQVFLNPAGDHYRTRMTHTLEVARIARTISRALGLNEDLTEAVALGHDLGHTPFGHAGERALDEILRNLGYDDGFTHNSQSLRVVDRVEKDGLGLNLTFETRDGILKHPTSAKAPATYEGRVVRLADRMTYVNHDADDAVRAGIFTDEDIPADIRNALGARGSERLDTLVRDVIETSEKRGEIKMSDALYERFDAFFRFLTERLYRDSRAKNEETKVFGILQGLFGYYADNPNALPPEYRIIAEEDGLHRAVCDYVSGMTDSYALHKYDELFIPNNWNVY